MQHVIQIMKQLMRLQNAIPYFLGGSADLISTQIKQTLINGEGTFHKLTPDSDSNIYFGVREFAMASMLNGMMLTRWGYAYIGGTFFVFCDYLKPADAYGSD